MTPKSSAVFQFAAAADEFGVSLAFDNTYGRLPEAFYTRLQPTPLPDPYLVAFNPAAAELIGLDPASANSREFVETFTGNRVPPGADPLAAIYAGHQFGTFVPQLGDGRAILLGEARGPTDRNGGALAARRWDLQLKGAGRTPYSRMGDGRAVLRSTIREYLCSEAMHGLGIPTTRALCITGSESPVVRESIETAAVLTRMAPSHVRFGSFEVFYYRRQHEHIRTLADYVLREHFPALLEADMPADNPANNPADNPADNPYVALLAEIVRRTAELVSRWQAVGFCHGVMNTDNMSILGITIDYGPYGFLDGFDWNHICNHSDEGGRYAYNMQPKIAHWNLFCLAQALLPLMEMEEAEEALAGFEPAFDASYAAQMRAKLGLATAADGDAKLLQDLLALMHASRTDFTIFFRALARFDSAPGATNTKLRDQFTDRAGFDGWARDYASRLASEGSIDAERLERMDRANPAYVLRNWMAEQAIAKARDNRDYAMIEELRSLLAAPFTLQQGKERYAAYPPDWAGAISVSCSS